VLLIGTSIGFYSKLMHLIAKITAGAANRHRTLTYALIASEIGCEYRCFKTGVAASSPTKFVKSYLEVTVIVTPYLQA